MNSQGSQSEHLVVSPGDQPLVKEHGDSGYEISFKWITVIGSIQPIRFGQRPGLLPMASCGSYDGHHDNIDYIDVK